MWSAFSGALTNGKLSVEPAHVQRPPAQTAACRRRHLLLAASTGGMIADLVGAFAGVGPQKNVPGPAPHAAIGFVEAHGLAFIIGVLL